MIEPMRLRALHEETKYHFMKKNPRCLTCHRKGTHTPAMFMCVDCAMKGYCQACFKELHPLTGKKGGHKKKQIMVGKPFKVHTVEHGDERTYPKQFDWVTVHYQMMLKKNDRANDIFLQLVNISRRMFGLGRSVRVYGEVIDSSYRAPRRPLKFQTGCSGPCLHVQIINGANLAAMDDNGFSDPYVAVWWKDTLVGTTRVLNKTLNPVWANETFVIPLSKDFVNIYNDRDKSIVMATKIGKGGDHHKHVSGQWKPGMPLTPQEAASIVAELNGHNLLANLPKLRIDVFDYDRFSKNDFLGQKTLSDNEILQLILENDESQVRSFNLGPKKARGVIGVKLGHIIEEGKLILQIVDGKNLPKADPFNLSDPYCNVYWNDKMIGKTKTIRNTLDPLWNLAYFEIKLEADNEIEDIENGKLKIEVYDWDRVGGDDKLGELILDGPEMQVLIEKSATTAELGLDETVLRTIEDEFRRLEGTPKESQFQLNVWCLVDEDKKAEREALRAANEAEKLRKLQEKIEDGFETPEEAKKRKKLERDLRNRMRAITTEAKKALKRELKIRGMKTAEMAAKEAEDLRQLKKTMEIERDGAEDGDEDDLGSIIAAAKNEAFEDVEKGVDHDATGEFKQPEEGAPREERKTRKSRKSKGKGPKTIAEVDDEELEKYAQDPELYYEKVRKGEMKIAPVKGTKSKKAGKRAEGEDDEKGEEDEEKEEGDGEGENADREEGEEGDGDDEEDSDDEDDDDEEDEFEGYEKGSCTAYSETLGIKVTFQDYNGMEMEDRVEWITLANIPLKVKMGDNPALLELKRQELLDKQPLWKRLFISEVKLNALVDLELEAKDAEEASWIDKLRGAKNLGIKTYYSLQLDDIESGINDVKGQVGVRIMYHTRGTVLRGIDEVIQTMTLGEKTIVNIRSDYAFGECWGGENLPPNSDVTVELTLVGVGMKGAIYLLVMRQINFVLRILWAILQCVVFVWESFTCHKLLCPAWCHKSFFKERKEVDFDLDDFDEDAMLAEESIVKMEEAKEEVVEEKGASTLGARLLFGKF